VRGRLRGPPRPRRGADGENGTDAEKRTAARRPGGQIFCSGRHGTTRSAQGDRSKRDSARRHGETAGLQSDGGEAAGRVGSGRVTPAANAGGSSTGVSIINMAALLLSSLSSSSSSLSLSSSSSAAAAAATSSSLRRIPRPTAHRSLNPPSSVCFYSRAGAGRRTDPLLELAGPHVARQQPIDRCNHGPAGRTMLVTEKSFRLRWGPVNLTVRVDGPSGRCATPTTLLFSSHTCSKSVAQVCSCPASPPTSSGSRAVNSSEPNSTRRTAAPRTNPGAAASP
jgi:hypothetical protein